MSDDNAKVDSACLYKGKFSQTFTGVGVERALNDGWSRHSEAELALQASNEEPTIKDVQDLEPVEEVKKRGPGRPKKG